MFQAILFFHSRYSDTEDTLFNFLNAHIHLVATTFSRSFQTNSSTYIQEWLLMSNLHSIVFGEQFGKKCRKVVSLMLKKGLIVSD